MKMFKRIATAIALLVWAAGVWWLSGIPFQRSFEFAYLIGSVSIFAIGIVVFGPPWES